ncbi:purine nucleoside phosphorylase [Sesbania bispinosa]|nr:purine nucleoside phosphorylase [Sesbania bispinosa]
MEDYLRKNLEIFLAPVFKSVHWDITCVKEPGGCPEVEALTFQKDTKSIFSKDNATLCSSLGGVLGLSLNIEIPTTTVYKTGFCIVLMKPLPVCPFQKNVR